MGRSFALALALCLGVGCTPSVSSTVATPASGPDVEGIAFLARRLSEDAFRGRGPWTPENESAARLVASLVSQLGARPLVGDSLLVPFVTDRRPTDTVYNVIGVIPSRSGTTGGRLIGITAHIDHLGVGKPDASGDSIYNGFLDDAIGVSMAFDVARRYRLDPGNRPLVVMFFNLEEQGLLGAKAFVERPDVAPIMQRMDLLVGVDAGSPAGEAITWQLMGGLPEHNGTRLADSIARARGWTTTSQPPRAISDVFPFSQKGVPILFPIPGQNWRGYTAMERNDLMKRFDHYHSPQDEYNPAFPLDGTRHFADWLYAIISQAVRWP